MSLGKTGKMQKGLAAALRYLCAACLTLVIALPFAGAQAGSATPPAGRTVEQMVAGGCPQVYVPSAPAGKEGYSTLADAVDALRDGGVIWLTQNISVDQVTIAGKDVAIASSGAEVYTVSKSGSGENMLKLENGAGLTLERVAVDAAENRNGRTVSVRGSSSLTLGAGAVVENNTSHGAVYLDQSAIFVNGGVIRNNGATGTPRTKEYAPSGTWTNPTTRYIFTNGLAGNQGLGGAVLMVNGSTFAMTGGEISANTALYGGAVYAWKSGDITLAGGTVSNNTANGTDYNATGGAFCIDGGGCQVDVKGATFTGNRATQGGAFYFGIDAGKIDFIMTSGTFSKNSAKNGSVIYSVAADCVTDVSGNDSVFTQNTTDENGAIYVGMYPGNKKSDRAKIYIHDGAKFTENTAKKASCLYVARDGGVKSLLLDGAEFSNNETSNDAGVMQYNVPNSDFTVRNCTFKNNRSENRGGCFYVSIDAKGTDFTFENSTFIGNSARQEGGVWRGYPPECEILVKDCTFEDNSCGFEKDGTDVPDQKSGGGCFYFPGDGVNANVTFDGGVFRKNKSGASGGAFMIRLNGGTVTVKGGAVFEENEADVNAGAFSIRRKGEGFYGTAYLLECDVINNVCNADFSHYADADLEPTKHYNTGGVYVSENVTLYMYDALVTENYVEKGFEGNKIGSGIGLCPNAEVYLFPEHGAMIYGNGDGNTMDILAVPKDDTIHYETPAKLYICDTTPDGQPYGWTDLNGELAVTGEYDWTNLRNGIATTALNDGGNAAKDLEPVGFKANVPARIMTMAAGEDEYKVRITGNHTKEALYAAGGVMVNGTVISGDLEVSIHKEAKGPVEEDREFGFTFSITEDKEYGTENEAQNTGFNTVGSADTLKIQATRSDSGSEEVTFIKDAVESTVHSGYWLPRISYSFHLKAGETITFLSFKKDGTKIFSDDTDYRFELVETDSQGAVKSEIEYTVYDMDGEEQTGDFSSDSTSLEAGRIKTIAFTATNIFTELDLTKKVAPGGDTGASWNFTIQLKNESGEDVNKTYNTELWQDGAKVKDDTITFADGKAAAQLEHGQTLKIKGLPLDTEYTVTETSDDQYTAESAKASGKITEESNRAEVEFVNNPKPGSLKITKTNADAADGTKFAFTLTLTPLAGPADPEPFKGVAFKLNDAPFSPSAKAPNVWTFELGHGDVVLAENIPAGTTYAVTETLPKGYHQVEADGETGAIEPNRTAEAVFQNAKDAPGSLKITKTNADALDATKFAFTLTLTPSEDVTLDGVVEFVKESGEFADPVPAAGTDNTWTFELGHGDVLLVKNIPAGTDYTIAETLPEGYHQAAVAGATGAVESEKTAEAAFKNAKNQLDKREVTPGDGVPVGVGDEIIYEITWENYKLERADVEITDRLDPGATYVDAWFGSRTAPENPGGTVAYNRASHTVTWKLPNQEAQKTGVVTLKVQVNEKAKAAWSYDAPNAEADKTRNDLAVYNQAGVSVNHEAEMKTAVVENPLSEKTETRAGEAKVTPDDLKPDEKGGLMGPEVEIGDTIEYRISFRNSYDRAAKVTVRDPLDPGADFVSASYGGVTLTANAGQNAAVEKENVRIAYTATNRTVTWTLTDLPADTAGEVMLTVRVNEKALLQWNTGDAAVGAGKDNMVRNQAGVRIDDGPEAKTEILDNPVKEPQTGSLIVTKTVTGEGADTDKGFTFTVRLSDVSINGTYGDMTFVSGAATFPLKHGESKRAVGLPAGVRYTVTESLAGGSSYASHSTGDTGVIEDGKESTAAFLNVLTPPPELPKTSDRSHLILWMTVSLLALAGLAGCALTGKKRRNR